MSFRDDIEAARERVVSLERDVRAARERREADRIRIADLEQQMAPPFQIPLWRRALQLCILVTLVGGAAVCLGLLIAVAVDQPAPRPMPPHWRIPLAEALSRGLTDPSLIIEINADHLDREGRAHLEDDDYLRVRAQCQEVTWSADGEVKVEHKSSQCTAGPLLPIRCSPVEVWSRLPREADDLDWAHFDYWDGSWRVSRRSRRFQVADDCQGQFWPPLPEVD